MMAEGDRLRRLQMREARHDGTRVLKRLFRKRLLKPGEQTIEMVNRVPDIQTKVRGHLIVARAPSMQLAAHLAHNLD